MSEIRILTEADLDAFLKVVGNAFPRFANPRPSPSEYERWQQRLYRAAHETQDVHIYGLLRDDKLAGLMQLYDFVMNFEGIELPIGGVGLVAVDFFHKKSKVAKEMLEFYLRFYRERKTPFAALFPFRPDFYKQMGFGYGTKINQYNFVPAALPSHGNRRAVRALEAEDQAQVLACYSRVFAQRHGLFAKSLSDFERMFEDTSIRAVGYERDGELRAFCAFQFVPDPNSNVNDLSLNEFVYEDREALAGMLAFFHSQADQIRRIKFNSQDALFHHVLQDVRDDSFMHIPPIAHQSNRAGVGVMYRMIDIKMAFELLSERSFGGQNLTVKFAIRDSFLPENAGPVTVRFSAGNPSVLSDDAAYDCEVAMDIAEFSSLFMGVAPFSALHFYGLAEISDESRIAALDALFQTKHAPICMTLF